MNLFFIILQLAKFLFSFLPPLLFLVELPPRSYWQLRNGRQRKYKYLLLCFSWKFLVSVLYLSIHFSENFLFLLAAFLNKYLYFWIIIHFRTGSLLLFWCIRGELFHITVSLRISNRFAWKEMTCAKVRGYSGHVLGISLPTFKHQIDLSLNKTHKMQCSSLIYHLEILHKKR